MRRPLAHPPPPLKISYPSWQTALDAHRVEITRGNKSRVQERLGPRLRGVMIHL